MFIFIPIPLHYHNQGENQTKLVKLKCKVFKHTPHCAGLGAHTSEPGMGFLAPQQKCCMKLQSADGLSPSQRMTYLHFCVVPFAT